MKLAMTPKSPLVGAINRQKLTTKGLSYTMIPLTIISLSGDTPPPISPGLIQFDWSCWEQYKHKSCLSGQINVDEVFTFSSLAGYNELLQYVDNVSPEKIYLVDRHANEFAKTLEKMGYQAIALEKPTQLNLL